MLCQNALQYRDKYLCPAFKDLRVTFLGKRHLLPLVKQHRICLKTFRISKIHHNTKHTSIFFCLYLLAWLLLIFSVIRDLYLDCITVGNKNKLHRKKGHWKMNRWIKWLVQTVQENWREWALQYSFCTERQKDGYCYWYTTQFLGFQTRSHFFWARHHHSWELDKLFFC